MLNEGNQTHNFILYLWELYYSSGTVISYDSGSTKVRNYIMVPISVLLRQKVTVPTVPVPQHWSDDHKANITKITAYFEAAKIFWI